MGASGPDGYASGGSIDDNADGADPLRFVEGGGFSGGSAGDDEVDAGVDLPIYKAPESRLIDRAIRLERRNDSRTTTHCFHDESVYRWRVVDMVVQNEYSNAAEGEANSPGFGGVLVFGAAFPLCYVTKGTCFPLPSSSIPVLDPLPCRLQDRNSAFALYPSTLVCGTNS